jgi:hypothetical protein
MTEHREEKQYIPENIERKKRLQTVRPNDKDRDTETERKQKQGIQRQMYKYTYIRKVRLGLLLIRNANR